MIEYLDNLRRKNGVFQEISPQKCRFYAAGIGA
jgi:hypothetical protein